MQLKALLATITIGCLSLGCSSMPGSEMPQGSSLTSIDVNLPAKDKLPKGLQGEGLAYCFGISETEGGTPAYTLGQPTCETPYVSGATMEKGPYKGAMKLEGKLDSSKNYKISLVIGYWRPVTGNQPQAVSVALKDDVGIDMNRLFYHGVKDVMAYEMEGRSKVKVRVDLFPYGGDADANPTSITTPTELDLEVETVFNQVAP